MVEFRETLCAEQALCAWISVSENGLPVVINRLMQFIFKCFWHIHITCLCSCRYCKILQISLFNNLHKTEFKIMFDEYYHLPLFSFILLCPRKMKVLRYSESEYNFTFKNHNAVLSLFHGILMLLSLPSCICRFKNCWRSLVSCSSP